MGCNFGGYPLEFSELQGVGLENGGQLGFWWKELTTVKNVDKKEISRLLSKSMDLGPRSPPSCNFVLRPSYIM